MFFCDIAIQAAATAASINNATKGMTKEQREVYFKMLTPPEKPKTENNSTGLFAAGLIGFIFGSSM